jgi:hypothetical protein
VIKARATSSADIVSKMQMENKQKEQENRLNRVNILLFCFYFQKYFWRMHGRQMGGLEGCLMFIG